MLRLIDTGNYRYGPSQATARVNLPLSHHCVSASSPLFRTPSTATHVCPSIYLPTYASSPPPHTRASPGATDGVCHHHHHHVLCPLPVRPPLLASLLNWSLPPPSRGPPFHQGPDSCSATAEPNHRLGVVVPRLQECSYLRRRADVQSGSEVGRESSYSCSLLAGDYHRLLPGAAMCRSLGSIHSLALVSSFSSTKSYTLLPCGS
jgi:hypothetical protein